MKLLALIEALRDPDTAAGMAEAELPGVEFMVIDTYMVKEIDLESEIRFFDAESIPPPGMYINVDGIDYVNWFPLSMMQEMVEDFFSALGPDADIHAVAKRLIHYRIYDA